MADDKIQVSPEDIAEFGAIMDKMIADVRSGKSSSLLNAMNTYNREQLNKTKDDE